MAQAAPGAQTALGASPPPNYLVPLQLSTPIISLLLLSHPLYKSTPFMQSTRLWRVLQSANSSTLVAVAMTVLRRIPSLSTRQRRHTLQAGAIEGDDDDDCTLRAADSNDDDFIHPFKPVPLKARTMTTTTTKTVA